MARQCNPSGNVSFPLQFTSGNRSAIPINNPSLAFSFKPRNPNKLNPKYEDISRTSGGLLDESSNSLTINYNNYNYTLLSSQICLSTNSILLDPSKSVNNKIDYIITLESDKDQYNNHIAPDAFMIIVIPLIKVSNDTAPVDNLYLGSISNNDISGNNYNIKTIFTGLTKFVWYETCLEPHGDNAFVYISTEGLTISENLYWNLLATWRKDSPYDIQSALTGAVTNIKKNIKDFCSTTSSTSDVNILDNSINALQASVYVPKVNKRIETWPSYTPPYDIVLNVQSNPVVISSMTNSSVEGFDNSTPTITGVYATETGGLNIPIIPTGTTSPSQQEILNDLQNMANNSVNGQIIDLGQFKCVPLDMDGAIDASGVHFDLMGQPLTDLFKQRNALRDDSQVNKVSVNNLEIYFAYAIAVLVAMIIILFVIIPWARKNIFHQVTIQSSLLPNKAGEIGFYIIMGLIAYGTGFMLGAAVTSF